MDIGSTQVIRMGRYIGPGEAGAPLARDGGTIFVRRTGQRSFAAARTAAELDASPPVTFEADLDEDEAGQVSGPDLLLQTALAVVGYVARNQGKRPPRLVYEPEGEG